jgi:hypothetical protein
MSNEIEVLIQSLWKKVLRPKGGYRRQINKARERNKRNTNVKGRSYPYTQVM